MLLKVSNKFETTQTSTTLY